VLSIDQDPTEDGFLTIREIYGLAVDTELVVISSCSAAGGRPIRGEGVIALARPFLAAGASATVVSLWPVNDRSSAAFMDAFYSALAQGQEPAAALRSARAAMLVSDRAAWRLPFHWASFVVMGASG
jgi:CHAT domain-containing protein